MGYVILVVQCPQNDSELMRCMNDAAPGFLLWSEPCHTDRTLREREDWHTLQPDQQLRDRLTVLEVHLRAVNITTVTSGSHLEAW